ncbi:septum formation initiator family protein [Horticoccus luteus]|uniref:Septum formation initiator family protein n=1 Tax=Horticoccus luteus TaxID=2862869 RepID=A0A8F9TTM2_9BACT|nr:septum formation initiator family protein [Horticoccus luteus]
MRRASERRHAAARGRGPKRIACANLRPFICRPVVNLRRFIFTVYLGAFFALAAAAGVFFWQTRAEYDRLRQQQVESQRRLQDLEQRLAEQEKVLERLRTDPAYVEKVIRQQLGYAKPDEYIFRFPP